MTVRVLLFARARELAKTGEVTLELPAGATVADFRVTLAAQQSVLAELLALSAVAVDEEFADDDTIIRDGAVAAVIPPVSGG
ncbi:MAG: molybdopterin converting factor subunit 1 [Gemmataceae bacterium]